MQQARGFIVGCANQVTLISWEAEHTKQQIGQAFYMQKNHTISILHTGYKVIGCTFAKQSYWHKLRGLLFKLRRPQAFQLSHGLFTGCILIGQLQVTRWGRGIPPFHRKPKPKSRPPASPSPAAPHNKNYFSASKTKKKNNRHMNYRHW